MNGLLKKMLLSIQLKVLRFLLEPSYYNEILFFQNIRGKKFNDKKYKESIFRSIFHQLDKKLLSKDVTSKSIKSYEEKLKHYVNGEIDFAFTQWADSLISYAKNGNMNSDDNTKKFESTLSPDALFDLIAKRRSIRCFDEKEISSGLVKEIISAGLFAPTGCNRQNVNYLLLNNSEDKSFCQRLAGEPGRFVTEAPIGLVILIDCRTYTCLGHRHQAYLETGAAVQNMILFALSHKIGSIWLNWATTSINKLEQFYKRFKIPDYYLPTAMVLFGYIKKWPPIVPVRKRVESCLF